MPGLCMTTLKFWYCNSPPFAAPSCKGAMLLFLGLVICARSSLMPGTNLAEKPLRLECQVSGDPFWALVSRRCGFAATTEQRRWPLYPRALRRQRVATRTGISSGYHGCAVRAGPFAEPPDIDGVWAFP